MAAGSGWSLWAWMLIIGTLASGTIAGITSKVLYAYDAEGTCGTHAFNKPYFLVMAMFIGEALCLAFYYGGRWLEARKRSRAALDAPLMDAASGDSASSSPTATNITTAPGGATANGSAGSSDRPPRYYYFILSCFDLSATSLGLVGLTYIDASTYSMLRGSMVVFTVLFSAVIIRARYSRRQIVCIVVVVVGLAIVGGVGFLRAKYPAKDTPTNDDDSGASSDNVRDQTLGVTLVTFSSALNAAQNVVEELLLKKYVLGPNPVHPLEVVGWEGIFGLMTSSFVLLPVLMRIPGSDCDKQEDTLDTLHMIGSNGGVIGLVLPYLLSLAFMNWSSVAISQVLTAVHRQLVSACRTACIWVIELFIYYVVSKTYGEFWDEWSWLQLAGFIVMLLGTVSFSVVTVRQRQLQQQQQADEENLLRGPPAYSPSTSSASPATPVNLGGHELRKQKNYDAEDLRALAEHDQLHYHDPTSTPRGTTGYGGN